MITKVLCWQFVRFGIVGLASNLGVYLFYFGITSVGLGYKLAMTFSYVVGFVQTYIST